MKAAIDRQALERDILSGKHSDRELGAKYGTSHTTVRRFRNHLRAQHGDLLEQIAHSARFKAAATAAGRALDADAKRDGLSEDDVRAVVEAASDEQAKVIGAHQASISVARKAIEGMLNELQGLAMPAELIERMVRAQRPGATDDEVAQAARAYQELSTLGARTIQMQRIVTSLVRVIMAERVSHGIDQGEGGAEPYEERLRRIAGEPDEG